MPIRPENKTRYPKAKVWKAMVEQARERGGNRCECDGKCGLDHGGRCAAMNGQPHPATGSKVVLTLAHEHGVALEETSIDRMFHACQQCHNRYDAPMRRAGIAERARAALGIPDMFATSRSQHEGAER
jgi:hypothetical protein